MGYVQSIQQSLIRPIGGWTNNGFAKVYSLYSQYQNKLNQQQNDDSFLFELSLTKLNLKNEMQAILQYKNNNLVQHFDAYWKSYQESIRSKSQILKSTKNKNENDDFVAYKKKKENETKQIDEIEYDESEYFDIYDVNEKVGYNDDNDDNIIKYKVTLLHGSIKRVAYKRVIYICKRSKSMKLLGVKPEIIEYELQNIERVRKEYS